MVFGEVLGRLRVSILEKGQCEKHMPQGEGWQSGVSAVEQGP